MAQTHDHDDEETTIHDGLGHGDQAVAEVEEGEEEQPKLDLDVKIDDCSACERHIAVTISRADIDRFMDKEYRELVPEAHVPGFRPGHAPRKLVEHRFRKEVANKVKGELVMASMEQIHEDYDLSAISEPDLDLSSIEVPETGPMTFEFDLEVRPQFDMPQWKGLRIEKPIKDFTDADVDRAMTRLLSNRGSLAPVEKPARPGDYITTNLTFKHGDIVLSSAMEEVIRLRPTLSFRDGKIEGFDLAMTGVRGGETRSLAMTISEEADNESLRGQPVTGVFDVLEVKVLQLPELTPELLEELGGFKLEADLRDALKDSLVQRLEYRQRQVAREQITKALTVAANWALPEGLLQRQSHRELERAVMELQRSGFGDEEIRAHENALRQNSRVSTARALKEHFILERIAEEQEIEVDEAEYETEIALIARQTNDSPRRIRARLEKSGSWDVLRNQIVERKVIDVILENAVFDKVPYRDEESDVAALDLTAAGAEQSEIPQAKPGSAEPIDELAAARGEKPERAKE
jgi:trigger factor